MILPGRPLFMEELVSYTAVNMRVNRSVLCCAAHPAWTLHLCCAAPVLWLKDWAACLSLPSIRSATRSSHGNILSVTVEIIIRLVFL